MLEDRQARTSEVISSAAPIKNEFSTKLRGRTGKGQLVRAGQNTIRAAGNENSIIARATWKTTHMITQTHIRPKENEN